VPGPWLLNAFYVTAAKKNSEVIFLPVTRMVVFDLLKTILLYQVEAL